MDGGGLTPIIPRVIEQPRHLAVRLPNWVGDVCMVLPALARLRAAGFHLHGFGRGWLADLLAAEPDVITKLPGGLWADAAVMRASGCRDGVLFTNSIGSALRMRLAGIRAVGHGGVRSLLMGRTVARERGSHEVDAFWRIAGALCSDGQSAIPPLLGWRPAARHVAEAEAALAAAGVGPRFVVCAPLAVGTIHGLSKQWPGFPLLCRMLSDRQPVVACPGPGEEAATARALPGAIMLNGLKLGAYAVIMSRALAVVANDSGPMHLGAAAGASVVGVFGVSDPGRTRPWSPRARAVGGLGAWPTVDIVAAAAMGTTS